MNLNAIFATYCILILFKRSSKSVIIISSLADILTLKYLFQRLGCKSQPEYFRDRTMETVFA